MKLAAVIGGSGLSDYPELEILETNELETPFGLPSSPLRIGQLNGQRMVFLPRHGEKHTIPPHRINYRANIHALKQLGVTAIYAVAAVGGITDTYEPGSLVVPDQLIDYTHGRETSFYSDNFRPERHIDFSRPYDETLRQQLLTTARTLNLPVIDGGVYGAVQGPRLETAAEILRMRQDGCDLVGMTGMPEAYLARELDLPYVTLAVVANWAAGIGESPLHIDEINQTLAASMRSVQACIAELIRDN